MLDYFIRKTESDNKLTVVLGYFQWTLALCLQHINVNKWFDRNNVYSQNFS